MLLDSIAYYQARGNTLKMIGHYQKFGELSESQSDFNNWVWARCMTAQTFRDLNQVDSILMIMKHISTRIDTTTNPLPDSTQARAYLMQGLAVYFDKRVMQKTLPYFHKAASTAPDHPVSLTASSLIASLYFAHGDIEKGNAKMDSVLHDARRILAPSHPFMTTINIQNAGRWLMLGNHEKALDSYASIIEQERKRRAPNLYALGVALLGGEHSALNLGKQARFLRLNDSLLSLPFHQFANGNLIQGTAYAHRASYFEQKGDYEEAMQWAITGLQFVQEYSQGSDYIDDAGNGLAQILIRTGQPDSAAIYLKQLTQKQRLLMGESSPFLTLGYTQLSLALTQTGEFDSAYVYLQQLKQLLEPELTLAGAQALNIEVNLYLKWGKLAEAKQAAKAYEELLTVGTQPDVRAFAHLNLAAIASEEKEMAQAVSSYMDAWEGTTGLKEMRPIQVSHLPKILNIPIAVEILIGTADQFYDRYTKKKQAGDLTESIRLLDQALHLSALGSVMYREQQSQRFQQETIRPTYQKALAQCHEAYELKPAQRWITQAIRLTERNKSQQLRQSIREDEGLRLAEVDQAVLSSLKGLKFLIVGKKNQIESVYGNPQLAAHLPQLEQERFMLEDSLQRLIHQIEEDYPDFYQSKFQVEPLSALDIQTALPDQTALISYSFDQNNLHLFVVRADTMIWHRSSTPIDSIFFWTDELYQICTSEFSTTEEEASQIPKYIASASSLYQSLVQPIAGDLAQIKHLHIAPDDRLYTLPFESLLSQKPAEEEASFEDMEYLLYQWDVSYTYAASASLMPRQTPASPTHIWMGWGPFTAQLQARIKAKKTRTDSESSFAAMHPLQLQNELIASLGKRSGFKARIGKEATKADFFQYAENAGAIHLGLHGMANLQSPHKSMLTFAPDLKSGVGNQLFAQEISTLSLRANFIFLAACETSTGMIQFGEGLLSLARRFQMAGCPSLIASRWKAKSRETTMIAHSFYDYLFQQETKSSALSLAKRAYLANPHTLAAAKHPRYWASLALIGETGTWSFITAQ